MTWKTKNNTCPICGQIANTITGHACKHLVKVQANGYRIWRIKKCFRFHPGRPWAGVFLFRFHPVFTPPPH